MGTPIDEDYTKASGTSFAAPYTGAAYVNALYAARGDWDGRFEKAAPDIPGSKADGEGLLKLSPALNGAAPDDDVDATVWSLPWTSEDWVHVDADLLDDGEYRVDPDDFKAAFGE